MTITLPLLTDITPTFGIADLWLPALLLGIGVALLLAEVFVLPGFGVAGVSGLISIVVGMFLGIHTLVVRHGTFNDATGLAISAGGTALGSTLLGAAILWLLPKIPGFRRMMPRDRATGEAHGEAFPPRHHMMGQQGVSKTPLRPSGIVTLETGEVVDVVTKGEFIDTGSHVFVENIDGPSVIVRKL
ncbi:MAG: hypothetical protein IT462_10710 [Planctomycetes bacterium]|nr:hypothetical protein [Planctomycetota bacterium]